METSPFEEMKWSSENNIFRFQGFSFQNAWGVHSLLLLTQRGGCFWSNFSNWSSLFSPGSISVSDQIHQAAFPSKMAVIKLLNSMEISIRWYEIRWKSLQPWLMTLLMAWPVARTNKSSSLVQIHPNFNAISFFFRKKSNSMRFPGWCIFLENFWGLQKPWFQMFIH